MSAAIEVRQVTKTYAEGAGSARALDCVDLSIHAGQVALLMGPSGSGKTTLLSILGCILRPTSGEVRIGGKVVSQLPENELSAVRLQYIGFVFQGFNLFPALTAAENVAIALDLKGIRGPAAHRRSRALLDEVGLAAKCDAHPADLSGGEKQRVAIARALAADAEIILADEPTAALDRKIGGTVMELLHELAHAGGRAVVVVTHDGRMAEYADRIVQLEDGRILNDGLEAKR